MSLPDDSEWVASNSEVGPDLSVYGKSENAYLADRDLPNRDILGHSFASAGHRSELRSRKFDQIRYHAFNAESRLD